MTPYIYQTVHVLYGKPLHLDGHIAILNKWSQSLFNRAFIVDLNKLATKIKDVILKEKCHTNLSSFVCVKLSATGVITLSFEGTSLYEGYALRSISHCATTYRYNALFIDAPTSVRRASTAFALAQVQSKGATCIVQHDSNNIIISANDSPFFAIKDDVVYTPPMEESVERKVAIDAIKRAQLRVIEQDISIDQLPLFDELFLFDHMGITSISHCEGEPYTSIVVERIAKVLHGLM